MNTLKKSFILTVIKRIDLKKTYLPSLTFLFAVHHILKNKSLSKHAIISAIAVTLSYLLSSLDHNHFLPPLRYIQLLSMIVFSDYAYKFINQKELNSAMKSLTILSIIFVLHGYIFPIDEYSVRNFLIFHRVAGIAGEPNYSAAILFSISVYFIFSKERWWSILSITLGLFSFSRAYIISIIFLVIILLIKRINHNSARHLSKLLILFIVTYPITLEMMHQYLPVNVFSKIYNLNPRIKHQLFFINHVKENPLGLGIKQSTDHYRKNYNLIYKKGMNNNSIDEQHNLTVEILADLGVFGYAYFVFLIIYFVLRAEDTIYTSLLLTPYIFINGLNEILLYILIPILTTKKRK